MILKGNFRPHDSVRRHRSIFIFDVAQLVELAEKLK